VNKLLEIGDSMPDVTLRGGDGQPVKLRELLKPGGLVVCFRDQYEDFVAAGADVVGISADSPSSHDKFKAKHRLPFRLLSDDDKSARAAFGVKSTFGLLPGRVTFVFDGQGVVRYVFDSQLRVNSHVEKSLEVLRRLPKAGATAA
jgi:peroxiredoxin Q/BCP